MPAKRRLPVLAPLPDGPERPPWQWVGFGALAIIASWLPLAFLAQVAQAALAGALLGHPPDAESTERAVGALSGGGRAALALSAAGPHAVALLVAAGLGGALVGRWGAPRAGGREAVLGGVLSALVASALGWTGAVWLPVVIALLAAAGALGGARLARRRGRASAN